MWHRLKDIRPNDFRIVAVKEFPTPKCPGCSKFSRTLCSYFRKLVKNILVILGPLYDLIKKRVMFKFDHKQTEAFELLKSKLVFLPKDFILIQSRE